VSREEREGGGGAVFLSANSVAHELCLVELAPRFMVPEVECKGLTFDFEEFVVFVVERSNCVPEELMSDFTTFLSCAGPAIGFDEGVGVTLGELIFVLLEVALDAVTAGEDGEALDGEAVEVVILVCAEIWFELGVP
jgi:hypothetical protein